MGTENTTTPGPVSDSQLADDVRVLREALEIHAMTAHREAGAIHVQHAATPERLARVLRRLEQEMEARQKRLHAALAAPVAQPCPNAAAMGEYACADKAQCWEPCGDLGHSEEHAVPAPVAQQPLTPHQLCEIAQQSRAVEGEHFLPVTFGWAVMRACAAAWGVKLPDEQATGGA